MTFPASEEPLVAISFVNGRPAFFPVIGMLLDAPDVILSTYVRKRLLVQESWTVEEIQALIQRLVYLPIKWRVELADMRLSWELYGEIKILGGLPEQIAMGDKGR